MNPKRTTLFILSLAVILSAAALGARALYRNYQDRQVYYANVAAQKRADIAITIPEGWRREQIATRLEQLKICSAADFMAASEGHEGHLFPDTYRFFQPTPATQVVTTLTNNFDDKTKDFSPTENQTILASIVEREAKYDSERTIIAGVYANRLAIGMKLDADPTVQYGKETNELMTANSTGPLTLYKYWQPITQDDYTGIISPYNTYLNAGLPPSPIANPGLASLAAATNPAKHDYYYFLHKDGVLYPSRTLSEHQSKQR